MCSLKEQHRKNVARKIILSVEKKKTLPKIYLLLGMQMLVAAWYAVTTKTAVICFHQSKISSDSQKLAIAEDDYSFKELEEEIENLRSFQPDLVSKNMDVAFFTDVDAEVPAVELPPSDAEIAAELLETDAEVLAVELPPSDAEIAAELLETEDVSNDNDDATDPEDEPMYCPDRNELLQTIETMQKFYLFSKDGAIVQSYANHVPPITDQHIAEKSR